MVKDPEKPIDPEHYIKMVDLEIDKFTKNNSLLDKSLSNPTTFKTIVKSAEQHLKTNSSNLLLLSNSVILSINPCLDEPFQNHQFQQSI